MNYYGKSVFFITFHQIGAGGEGLGEKSLFKTGLVTFSTSSIYSGMIQESLTLYSMNELKIADTQQIWVEPRLILSQLSHGDTRWEKRSHGPILFKAILPVSTVILTQFL